jgi:hypothetical protein
MFTTHQSLVKAAVWITSVILLPSCVGTELVAPSDHPGNPNARSGKLPVTVGLLSDFDAGTDGRAAPRDAHDHGAPSHETGEAHDPHAGHGSPSSHHQHQHGSATAESSHPPESTRPADTKAGGAVRYTCPMHPEVVRGEPGTCPKCGMKLVPKAKDPK